MRQHITHAHCIFKPIVGKNNSAANMYACSRYSYGTTDGSYDLIVDYDILHLEEYLWRMCVFRKFMTVFFCRLFSKGIHVNTQNKVLFYV